uniref:uncharacterized protein LOC109953445 n=1 Tax=Monopterus albus TaxID=43700 RepID=UPI0009B3B56E
YLYFSDIFSGAVTTALSFLTVRDGADVTLSCESLIDGQEKCDGTTWLFSNSRSTSAVALIELGQTGKEAESKSDRLSVTENCSLVIKKVTAEDVGRYTCRQFDKSGRQQGRDNVVDLSVVTMTEQKDTDKLTLLCSLWTDGRCIYTVKWLLKGNNVDKNNKDLKTSQSPCNATLTFNISHFIYSLRDKSLTCDVTNRDQRFTVTFQPTVEDKTPAITKPTRATEKTTTVTRAGPDPPGSESTFSVCSSGLLLSSVSLTFPMFSF